MLGCTHLLVPIISIDGSILHTPHTSPPKAENELTTDPPGAACNQLVLPRLTRHVCVYDHEKDEAIVHGDEDLLVEVYGRLQRQSWARWRAKVPDLLSLLDDSIPASEVAADFFLRPETLQYTINENNKVFVR